LPPNLALRKYFRPLMLDVKGVRSRCAVRFVDLPLTLRLLIACACSEVRPVVPTTL
jgi:hypothetical protein